MYITQDIPALDAGSLRHYHLLRCLGKSHPIHLVSLVFRSELAAERVEAVRPLVKDVSLVHVYQEPRGQDILRAARRKLRVKLAERRSVKALRERVNAVAAKESVDVVLLTSKLALDAVADVRVPVVVDCCDAPSLRASAALKQARGSRKVKAGIKWLRRRRTEKRVAAFAPDVAFASERDLRAVVSLDDGCVIVPNGIDLTYWTRRSAAQESGNILFFGALDYEPNHDAAMWLVTRIYPLILQDRPDATLAIVGRDPRLELREAARKHPRVTVTGRVEDIRPYMERASVACLPLRVASGIQNKVLEALAMEVPLVTTPAAAAGVRPSGTEELPLIIADNEADVAQGVLTLLSDETLRRQQARNGRAFVTHHFDWGASAERVEQMLRRAIERADVPA